MSKRDILRIRLDMPEGLKKVFPNDEYLKVGIIYCRANGRRYDPLVGEISIHTFSGPAPQSRGITGQIGAKSFEAEDPSQFAAEARRIAQSPKEITAIVTGESYVCA